MKVDNKEKENSSDYSVSENFDWVEDKNFPKEFLEFPLNEWKDLLYDSDHSNYFYSSPEDYFKNKLYKFLEKDIFPFEKIYKENESIMKIILNKYNIDKEINPDFFVNKIERDKFIFLL